MKNSLLAICCGLMLAATAGAEAPPGNMGQLQQLNRDSEAALGLIQRTPETRGAAPTHLQGGTLDRQQQAAQQRLQESQRRELLLFNQRSRNDPAQGVPSSLQGAQMQQRFQREQQMQLNRFRQQQLSPWR